MKTDKIELTLNHCLLALQKEVQSQAANFKNKKAVELINIKDLAIISNLNLDGTLKEAVVKKIKERVDKARSQDSVWERQKKEALEMFKAMGVVSIPGEEFENLIFNDSRDFKEKLISKAKELRNNQKQILKNLPTGIGLKIPNSKFDGLLEGKIKFKVEAVFEVEFFEGKEEELIEALQKKLKQAHFKTMPEIKVSPLN